MVDLKIIALLVVTMMNVTVAGYVFFKRKRHPAVVPFVFFTGGISLWALTNALFQLTTDPRIGMIDAALSYYAGLIMAIPFCAFAANFPKPLEDAERKRLSWILWAYVILWATIITIPGLTLRAVVYDPTGRILTGPGLYFHFFSITAFILGGIYWLWRKRKRSTHLERSQINLILVGSLIPALAGITLNLIFPVLGYYDLVWLGPNFALVLIACMGYAIMKRGLFNIRVLAVEIFAALFGLFVVVEWLQSATTGEFIWRGCVVLVYAFISWQLLSSVHKEIKAREALEDLMEQKTDFVHMASHQLRTPLTAIRGLVSMLYDGDYDHDPVEKQKQVQKNILLSVDRLANSVNDILAAAELEKGVGGTFELGDVEPLVEQSIKTLELNYQRHKVTLHYRKPKKPLPKVRMRSKYLQQSFLNLIDNAQRYTPDGGEVTVSLTTDNEHITFSVTDTGIGIAVEDQAKMFHKFFRADNAKDIQTSGTGLGLYIVRKIVEEHGGFVMVSSAGVNRGTTFSISLPITE